MPNNTDNKASVDTVVAVIESKLDQLIKSVNDINNRLSTNDNIVRDLELKINTLEQKDLSQQKEIDGLKDKSSVLRNWVMGIVSGLIVSVVGSIILILIK